MTASSNLTASLVPPQNSQPEKRVWTANSTFGFRLLTENDILTSPDPSWLIQKWYPRGGLGAMYSAPGEGKSFVCLDQANCIASGTSWMGQKVEQGDVVYVFAEGGRGGFKIRQQAWRAAHNIPDEQRLPIWFLPEAVPFLNKNAPEALLEAIDSLVLPNKPVFIVLDTLSRMIPGGDENNQKDTSLLIANVDKVRRATGAFVLFAHHQPYGSRRLRGSTVLPGAFDTIVGLKPDGGTITLSVEKQKDDENATPIRVRLVRHEKSLVPEFVETGILVKPKKSKKKELTTRERVLLTLLKEDGQSFNQLCGNIRGRESALEEARDELLEEQHVTIEDGERGARLHCLTEEGRAVALALTE